MAESPYVSVLLHPRPSGLYVYCWNGVSNKAANPTLIPHPSNIVMGVSPGEQLVSLVNLLQTHKDPRVAFYV